MEIIIAIVFWSFILWLCWKWFLGNWVGKLSAAKVVKAKLAAHQIPAEAYFEMAGAEVARGNFRKGLWVQAMSEALGDETRASAIYIQLRVKAMRREAEVAIRKASDKTVTEEYEELPEQKIVLNCPNCKGKLRLAAGKHLDVNCPHCRTEFRTHT